MAKAQIPVKRRILDGGVMAFEFEHYSPDYLVKNLGVDPILVSFSEEMDNDNSVKILKYGSEVISINFKDSASECAERNIIYVQGTGEVEVRQLWH